MDVRHALQLISTALSGTLVACHAGPDEVIPPQPDGPPMPVPEEDAMPDGPVDASPDAPIDPHPDAPGVAPYDPDGLPDIVLDADRMTGSWYLTSEFFTADACELVEQCIGGTGLRQLLVFDTVTGNAGANDLRVGAIPPPGQSQGYFEWSACHGHHHVTGYADYALLDGEAQVAAGHKQAFCLMDTRNIDGVSIPGQDYDCAEQGISRGWEDVYGGGLACQWIDVTDVPPGTYTVRVSINPTQQLPEMSYDNNVVEFNVTF